MERFITFKTFFFIFPRFVTFLTLFFIFPTFFHHSVTSSNRGGTYGGLKGPVEIWWWKSGHIADQFQTIAQITKLYYLETEARV